MTKLPFFASPLGVIRVRCTRACAILTLALLGGGFTARPASASIYACRTDPMVHLSNGTVIKLGAAVSDTASDVSQITYTVRVPTGVSVRHVVYTGGALADRETVQVSADNPNNTYDTDTTVWTGTSGVSVTATTWVQGVGSDTATGLAGQDLLIHLAG